MLVKKEMQRMLWRPLNRIRIIAVLGQFSVLQLPEGVTLSFSIIN